MSSFGLIELNMDLSCIHSAVTFKFTFLALKPKHFAFCLMQIVSFSQVTLLSSLFFIFYLAHVIEQPNLQIPNPQYLQKFLF